MVIRTLVLLILLTGCTSVGAQNAAQPPLPWMQSLAQDAITSGVSPATVQNALRQASLDERVIELDHKQPESTTTFDSYSHNILNPERIAKGRSFMSDYHALLQDVSNRYGVPPEIILALWSMESSFGQNSGHYNVIDSLMTLAYEGRRAEFFRGELIAALRILDTEHMNVTELHGSWAGAMGQCQFMPSTYLNHAVDYDNDGKRDIWENTDDVFASIANYLASEGWSRDLSWGQEVILTRPVLLSEIGLQPHHSLSEWRSLGIRSLGRNPLPQNNIQASLIQPDGIYGRSFLVTDNYRAIMRWNRSTYFATTIGLLADRFAN